MEKRNIFDKSFLIILFLPLYILERALRALASSSGGAACPGVPGVNPGGRPQESGGDSKAIKVKKIFVTNGCTYGWMDRRVGRNSDLDMYSTHRSSS